MRQCVHACYHTTLGRYCILRLLKACFVVRLREYVGEVHIVVYGEPHDDGDADGPVCTRTRVETLKPPKQTVKELNTLN